MKPLKIRKESLEQEDFFDNDYIEKVSEKYGLLIGKFIIKFNELEHEINQAIAKSFIDDFDSEGYRVIKFLNIANKIELFYEIYLERERYVDKKTKINIANIKNELDEIRVFRNKLVHANWSTLNKRGFVRTKIESNNKLGGEIMLVSVKILPGTIKKFIEKTDCAIIKIWEYFEA